MQANRQASRESTCCSRTWRKKKPTTESGHARQSIIYTSFKYGTFEGERNGRYFTDMTEETFAKLIQDMDELEIEEQGITSEVRPGRGEEKWLNLILRKE